MNRIKLFSFLLFGSLLISLSSCGGDDTSSNGNVDCNSSLEVNRAVADEVDAIAAALQTWINDQSSQNCNALKTAYQNYITSLSDLQDCANQAGVGQEFSDALSDAQNSIANLSC